MESLLVISDLLIVFALAGGVVFVVQRLKLPSLVGFILAGIIVGPYGLSLITNLAHVRILADIGVVILLFTVGLEFSISHLRSMMRVILTVGFPQVLLSALITTMLMVLHLGSLPRAVFAGMLVAFSSTAIVLKSLSDRGELQTLYGRISTVVLLLQDLLVIFCMLVMPVLAKHDQAEAFPWRPLVQGAAVVGLVLLVARYAVPVVVLTVVRARNRELFLIAIITLCFGIAALTAWAGLSLALGAFLAGLATSESEYSHQALAEVLPFRSTLSSVFFVSVGMLLDLAFVGRNWQFILGSVLVLLVLKLVAACLPAVLAGYSLKTAVMAGVALAQVGEFSFVLADRAMELKILEVDDYQRFLAAAVVTMILAPFLIALNPRLSTWLGAVRGSDRGKVESALSWETGREEEPSDHVVVAGYGPSGRNVVRVLREAGIPYVVLEINPETVRRARKDGERIYYGDCALPGILKRAGAHQARVFVIAISDPASTRAAVAAARRLNPAMHIVVRTRYLAEVEQLKSAGANEIIPEEFETSIEIFARVLSRYHAPRNLVLNLISRIRSDHYEMLREPRLTTVRPQFAKEILSRIEFESCLIPEASPALKKTIGELNLRVVTGATLIAVRRGVELLPNPGSGFRLEAGDVGFLMGTRAQVDSALALLDPSFPKPVAFE